MPPLAQDVTGQDGGPPDIFGADRGKRTPTDAINFPHKNLSFSPRCLWKCQVLYL